MATNKNQTSTGTVDYDYIDELEGTEIPRLESEVAELKRNRDNTQVMIENIRPFSVPYKHNSYSKDYDIGKLSILSSKFNVTWDDYKQYLGQEWSDKYAGHRLLSTGTDKILYITFLIIWMLATFAVIKLTNIHQSLHIVALSFLCFSYALFELLVLVTSTWYYVFRPNMINKKEARKKLKEIRSKLKVANNDLEVKRNLVKQYKIASINPNKELANIKQKQTVRLQKIVDDALLTVIPKIKNEKLRDSYSQVLTKCARLVDMANENGTIVSEISNIYNIYINDINSVLMKVEDSGSDVTNAYTMIQNFEGYVDRKIKKFSDLSNLSLESEINALSNAFKED